MTSIGRKVSRSPVNAWKQGTRKPSGENQHIFDEFEVKDGRWVSREQDGKLFTSK